MDYYLSSCNIESLSIDDSIDSINAKIYFYLYIGELSGKYDEFMAQLTLPKYDTIWKLSENSTSVISNVNYVKYLLYKKQIIDAERLLYKCYKILSKNRSYEKLNTKSFIYNVKTLTSNFAYHIPIVYPDNKYDTILILEHVKELFLKITDPFNRSSTMFFLKLDNDSVDDIQQNYGHSYGDDDDRNVRVYREISGRDIFLLDDHDPRKMYINAHALKILKAPADVILNTSIISWGEDTIEFLVKYPQIRYNSLIHNQTIEWKLENDQLKG